MEIRKFTSKDKWVGTHLVSSFNASKKDIVKAFGEPHFSCNDVDEKVQNEWNFMCDGHMVTIYDWKEYYRYSDTERLCWHIGSDCDDEDFISEVKSTIRSTIAKTR